MQMHSLGWAGNLNAAARVKRPNMRSLWDGSRTLLGWQLPALHADVIDPRFAAHYDAHIRPQADTFETNRREALRTLRRRSPFVVLGVVPLLIYLASPGTFGFDSVNELGFTLFAALAAAVWVWGVASITRYRAAIKEDIFSPVVQFFGPQWRYMPAGLSAEERTGGMASHMVFGLLPQHDIMETEDLVDGMHKDVAMRLFECTLTRGRGKHSRECFRGLVVHVQVPKRFSSHTVVHRDWGKVGNVFGKLRASNGLAQVRLEDPRFEARYEVFGTDAVEARYLLTPSFMERLIALEDLFLQQYGEKCTLRCAFKDGTLQITLASDYDRFHTGNIYRPVDFRHGINRVLREMDQLFAIIDVLQLDDRTGL